MLLLKNRDLFINLFILIIILIFFDLFALCFYLFLNFVSYLNIARDKLVNSNNIATKHGISSQNSSRLGGILILCFFSSNLIFNNYFNYTLLIQEEIFFYFIVVIFISFLGLADDLLGGVNHLLKLYLLIFSIIILLFTNDIFLFDETGVELFDKILDNKLISFFITLIVITGFINASNMSDGANGILSGISSILFFSFYLISNNDYYFLIFKFIFIFFLFNIFFGKVFLGDSGSYFLGIIISSLSLYNYNNNIVSAGFLACLLSYPCIEITFTIIRRLNLKSNPLKPDNKHLHNFLFDFFKTKFNDLLIANSLTGSLILIIFSLPPMFIYLLYFDKSTLSYWYVFLIQLFIYFYLYGSLSNMLLKK